MKNNFFIGIIFISFLSNLYAAEEMSGPAFLEYIIKNDLIVTGLGCSEHDELNRQGLWLDKHLQVWDQNHQKLIELKEKICRAKRNGLLGGELEILWNRILAYDRKIREKKLPVQNVVYQEGDVISPRSRRVQFSKGKR